MSIAMGWLIKHPDNPDGSIIWHNGGTGGYYSFIGFNKKHKTGLVILSNSTADVTRAGMDILKSLIE